VFAIGWPSESDECAAVSPRRSRAHAALRNACGCDDVAATRSGVSRTGMGVAVSSFYRFVVLMRLKYQSNTFGLFDAVKLPGSEGITLVL
jgi:hypothetical protein